MTERNDLAARVGRKAGRKLHAQRNKSPGVWFGLGMMGIIGWSVAVPTLLGTALGIWLDARYPNSAHSWTLALLVAGLVLGCANAWHWVAKEDRRIREDEHYAGNDSRSDAERHAESHAKNHTKDGPEVGARVDIEPDTRAGASQ